MRLPITARDRYVNGSPRDQLFGEAQTTRGGVFPDGFVFQAGQPDHVRLAYRKAMGLDG